MTVLIMPFCETDEDRHALKNHTFTILQFMWVICLVLCSWPNTASIKIALGTFSEEGIFFRAHWENEQNSSSCARRMRRCWLLTWDSSPCVSLPQEFTRPVKGKGDFSLPYCHVIPGVTAYNLCRVLLVRSNLLLSFRLGKGIIWGVSWGRALRSVCYSPLQLSVDMAIQVH